MKPTDVYVDLDGREFFLVHLDTQERKLLSRIQQRAQAHPDWDAFDNWWTVAIPAFYQARGLAREAVPRTIPWQIAQDQSSRLAMEAGLARSGDYRDELENLIREKYPSRWAFCEATGLTEDMLSHVLAGRKDLSLKKLTQALGRIGYRLHRAGSRDAIVEAEADGVSWVKNVSELFLLLHSEKGFCHLFFLQCGKKGTLLNIFEKISSNVPFNSSLIPLA